MESSSTTHSRGNFDENRVLDVKKLAAFCCDVILPDMLYESEYDEPQPLSSGDVEHIRGMLLQHCVTSSKLWGLNEEDFAKMMKKNNQYYFNQAFTSKLLANLKEKIPPMNWWNVIQAAKHENPAIARIIESILSSTDGFGDFQDAQAREEMIDAIKKKWKAVTSSEIEYTKSMLQRAANVALERKNMMKVANFNVGQTFKLGSNGEHHLPNNLVRDIFGVHKVFKFGAFRFEDYQQMDFMNDITTSVHNEDAVPICNFVDEDPSFQRLSLYPKWLIRDDLFQVFAVQFAVSHLVNLLEPKQIGDGLSIHCVVIPRSVVSLYDHDEELASSIGAKIPAEEICKPLDKTIVRVEDIISNLRNGFMSFLDKKTPSRALLLIDRRGNSQKITMCDITQIDPHQKVSELAEEVIISLKNDKPKLYHFKDKIIDYFERNPEIDGKYLFQMSNKQLAIPLSKHCGSGPVSGNIKGSVNKLRQSLLENFAPEIVDGIWKELRRNYVIEMQYEIAVDPNTNGKGCKTYFHYGNNQSIRFWPEQLIWFVPRLFLSENENEYDFLQRIYGSDYKHGFCINLDDAEFSSFYKMLTGWDHVSVNYRRIPLGMEQQEHIKLKEINFRDFIQPRLTPSAASKALIRFVNENAYDTDAIMDDADGIRGSVPDEVADSNVALTLMENRDDGSSLIHFLRLMLSYKASCNGACPLKQCSFFNGLIQNLQEFQAVGFTIDSGNIDDFNHLDIIRQMDHLVTVHELFSDKTNAAIREIIRDRIGCNLGEECTAFEMHCSRQREVDETKETEEDEITAKCTETKYTLCSAHCYLLHSAKYLYRMRGDHDKFDVKPFSMEVVEEKTSGVQGDSVPISIDWGQHILQWLPFGESPNFKSFLEEMARNPVSTVGPRTLEFLRKECEVLIEGTEYELDEMMGLKAYSDLTKFQKEFRRAHWKRTELEIKKNFYHWASTMYKAFLFHSKPIQKKREFDSPIPIYHGLDRMFTVDTATPSFQGPFSTTISDQVVRRFASDEGGRGRGLEFTLQSSYHNPLRVVTGINMIRISSFKHEQEILLYAQSTPISKTKAYEKEDEKLLNHLISSVQKRETLITDKNAFYKRIGFKFKKKWINLILKHPKLFTDSEYEKQMVVQRLQNELGIFGNTFKEKWINLILKHPQLFANSEFEHRIVAHRLQDELGIFGNTFKIHYGENNRLEIESEVQFEIMSSLKVPDSGVYFRITEDIIISSNTAIGMEEENENMKSNTAKYIIIESSGRITNGGVLQNIQSVDGMIALYGVEGVQNDGVIDCGVNGFIIIECSEFVNNGLIAPRPNVVIGEMETAESIIRNMASMNIGEPIKLTVKKHRGHRIDYNREDYYHPQNLLKEGTGDRYISDDECGSPNEDWIVFEHDEESRFIPTIVIIRNLYTDAGIKRIAIYGGNNIDDLEEWIEIDGIHNDHDRGYMERQIFPIGSRQRWIAYIEQFKYFKLRILENHGWEKGNVFYEFGILGVSSDI